MQEKLENYSLSFFHEENYMIGQIVMKLPRLLSLLIWGEVKSFLLGRGGGSYEIVDGANFLFSCRYFSWFFLKIAKKMLSQPSTAPVGCLFQITFHNVRVVNNFLFKNVGISTGRSSFICLTINYTITGQQISLLCKFPRQNAKKKCKKKLFSLQLNKTNRFYVVCKNSETERKKSLKLIFIFHAQELRK